MSNLLSKMPSMRMTRRRWGFTLVALVIVSAGVASLLNQNFFLSEKQRKLASVDARPAMQGKGAGGVEIEITAPVKGEGPGSVIELVANIKAKKNFKKMEYAWILPDGVSAAGGDLKGEVGVVQKGGVISLQLRVVKSTQENRQIHLKVFEMVGRKRVGNVAQYNTETQETLDHEIRTKAEMLRNRMPANEEGERRFKLMQ